VPFLSFLIFSYIENIDMIAEGVQGAFTGSEDVWGMHMLYADVRITHMLYADDLTLLANAPDAMQTMLNRLVVDLRSKNLTIKIAKS